MKLTEISQQEPASEYPATVAEYIKKYEVKTGAFLPLRFNLPNMIRSFEGTPFMVFELVARGTKLESFEGLKLQYASNVDLLGCPMRSYKNIHKHIRECDTIHVYATSTNLLGLFLCVKKPSNVFPNRIRLYDESDKEVGELTFLFNDLHSQEKDVHELQEALIEAGYPQYARL